MSSDSGCVGDDIIRFLLPAVCHLSADNTTRLALIRCKCHSLLVDYFTWKMGSFKSQLSPEADPLDRQDTEVSVWLSDDNSIGWVKVCSLLGCSSDLL